MEKDPGEYLKKKIKTAPIFDTAKIKNRMDFLNEPFVSVEYGEKGGISAEKEGILIKASYHAKGATEALEKIINNPTNLGEFDELRKIKNLKILDRFSIEKSELLTDLFEDLPKNTIVLFNPDSSDLGGSFYASKEGIVYIAGDITRIFNVLTFLHEIGHAVDYQRMSKEETIKNLDSTRRFNEAVDLIGKQSEDISGSKISDDNIEDVIRLERNAHAYMLKKIRPFLNNLSLRKEDVLKYIHDFSLESYFGRAENFSPSVHDIREKLLISRITKRNEEIKKAKKDLLNVEKDGEVTEEEIINNEINQALADVGEMIKKEN